MGQLTESVDPSIFAMVDHFPVRFWLGHMLHCVFLVGPHAVCWATCYTVACMF